MGFRNPSPSTPFIASLFGFGADLNKKGGFQLVSPSDQNDFRQNPPIGPALFGPGAFTDISNYITGNSANPYTRAFQTIGQTGDFSALPSELYNPYRQATSTLDELIGTSRPVVSALINNGLPVDVSGLVNQRYTKDILPSTAEYFNPSQGTGFQNIATEQANQLITELEYPAQEAARQRQLEAINVSAPTLAGLATSRTALPAAILGEAQNISQSTDPGARLLAALMGILNYSQQSSQFVDTQHTGTSGTAEIIGSIGNLIGGGMMGGGK